MSCLDLQAGTPALVVQNDVGDDDDDEPPLNENDDDDLDDIDQGEELSTQHLVLAQFDKVNCFLTYSSMHHINITPVIPDIVKYICINR